MQHTYTISGMTCEGCVSTVKSALQNIPEITSVEISLEEKTASIYMSEHLSTSRLQDALGGQNSKYQIQTQTKYVSAESPAGWFSTYKPILMIFFYITGITLLIQWSAGTFDYMSWMRHFMAGFFLIFSFFKMLDLKGFANSYAMYDVIAKRFPAWGYLYAFTELGLGVAYLNNFMPLVTNIVTFTVMSVSIIGVLQSVLDKRQIQCACLGAVFNLPMSTVTIIEDGLMILMAGAMIISLV
jgi:copper chaperone CopZ